MDYMELWKEFREAGLLWWVNRSLHLFGWAIFLDINDDGSINSVYPMRTKYRGFPRESEERGFCLLTDYLDKHSEELLEDLELPKIPVINVRSSLKE